MAKIKIKQKTNFGENMKQLKFSYVVFGMYQMICPFLKTLWQFLLRSNICLHFNAAIPSLVCNKTMSAYIHKKFHSTFIHRSTKWEISQISSIEKRVKQYGMLIQCDITQNSRQNKMDASQKYYVEWKKPDIRVHTVLYSNFHLFKILTQTKVISSDKSLTVVTLGGGGRGVINWERTAGNLLG